MSQNNIERRVNFPEKNVRYYQLACITTLYLTGKVSSRLRHVSYTK